MNTLPVTIHIPASLLLTATELAAYKSVNVDSILAEAFAKYYLEDDGQPPSPLKPVTDARLQAFVRNYPATLETVLQLDCSTSAKGLHLTRGGNPVTLEDAFATGISIKPDDMPAVATLLTRFVETREHAQK